MSGIITEEELKRNAAKEQGGIWSPGALAAIAQQQAEYCQGQTVSQKAYPRTTWKFCAYDGTKLAHDWNNCPQCGVTIPIMSQFLTGMTAARNE